MKITNRWASFETDVVQFQVQLSGGGPILDEGTIKYGETHQVPDEKLNVPDAKVFKLTVISVSEGNGKFETITLTKLSDVTIAVTNPFQRPG